MRPKFSIRLVDSMHDMSKAKVERVSKVRWVRIKQIDSDSGMNQKLDTGDKGLLTFLSITGDSSRLDNVGKTRGIRLGPKEVEVLSRMIEFFKNTESRVKTDEPTRDGSSGNPWSALEIIYDGRIKVFLANRPNAVFEETAQTFSDFFDELMK